MQAPDVHPRRVTVLGATGSIGMNTADILSQHPERYRVAALTAQENVAALAALARKFDAELAVIADETRYRELKDALAGTVTRIAAGKEALCEAAALDADIVVSAIVGAAGLLPTLEAIRRGALIALANKECLVSAGELVMKEARTHGATLLPVDSEHSALFQLFDPAQKDRMEKLILTASGGPFRTRTQAEMKKVTPAQAVKHPNWKMGAKISVDSATLMNKGLELIEAYHLFGVEAAKLEIVIHPESVIHGMVQYIDGSVLAQMSPPDMRTPIAYALGYPERISVSSPRLDLAGLSKLTFEAPDEARFPALRLAREALQAGGTAPCILNAANEIAVARFLKNEIGFLDIAAIAERALEEVTSDAAVTLETVQMADALSRKAAA